MFDLLKTLCALPGPSGEEDAVRSFIRSQAEPYADEIRTDPMGNLMVFRKGEKRLAKPVMLCAHMDEVGVIVKRVTEDGMLKFGFVGGVDPRVVIGRRVKFGNVTGVVGIKAVHLTSASERKTMPKAKDLYIDIGASSKSDALARVELGQYGVFDSDVVEFGDGLLKAKAIDDRLGCAVLLTLLKNQPYRPHPRAAASSAPRRNRPPNLSHGWQHRLDRKGNPDFSMRHSAGDSLDPPALYAYPD